MASRDLKGLTIEIGGDVSNLTTALGDVDRELSNLQSNLRTVNSALKLDPGNVDALAQRQELLNEAVETTAQRLETLREAQRQADEQIANGVEVDEQAYRNLRSEIIRAEASLNDYQRQANETGDTSRDATEESAEGWTMVKDVIADLASEAIQAAIEAFKDLVFEGEKALDLLQAKIGASDDAMRKYGDVAEDIFKNGWGESITDVAESIGTITQMLGDLDDVELRSVTKNALTLRDVFGWDVKESIRAVNSMMDQFGVTSDEAFNLIVQGAQNGLDQNDDLLDTINEYSQQFSDAGYSADDMFNMLVNGAKTGTWSVDKLGDAVKEMNIRISDGTADDAFKKLKLGVEEATVSQMKFTDEYGNLIAAQNKYSEAVQKYGKDSDQARSAQEKLSKAQQKYNDLANETTINISGIKEAFAAGGEEAQNAMSQVMEALLSVEDETEQYNLGVQIFGTMWEDLGLATVAALMDTQGAIASTNQAMSQVETDAYDNLASSVATLGRTLRAEILSPIVNAIAPAIKGLVDWTIENMDIVKPIILGVAAAFGVLATALSIAGIISAVQKAMVLLNGTLLANPIFLGATVAIAAIAGLVAGFTALIKASDDSGKAIKENAESVTAFGDALAMTRPSILDTTEVLSEYGRTISQIDGLISETESNITNIYSTALSEQRQLREDDLASIKEYNEELERLQKEKLEIHRQTMTVELMKINSESQTLSQEQTAQYLVNMQTALDQANAVSTESYNAKLAQIHNFHQTQGTLNTDAYNKDIELARIAYEQELADSQAFYNESLTQLQKHANDWIVQDGVKWNAVIDGSYKGRLAFKKALAEIDLDHANAFLSMYTTVVKTGGEITDETALIANSMVNTFDALPIGMQKAGKDALLGIVKGLEDEIPALENASEMTAQEIVDTLKSELQIQSPSRVTRSIGAFVSEGLQSGMGSKLTAVSQKAIDLAKSIVSGLKSKLTEMSGIGANMVEGVESGIQSKKSWIGSKISSFASGLVSSFKKAFNIQSPSRIMRDQIGAMLAEGIGVGIEENADAAISPMEKLKDELTSFDGVSVNKSINMNGNAQTGVQRLYTKLNDLYSLVSDVRQLLKDNAQKNIYIDKNRLVGELASDMDEALGEIASRKAVGAV